MATCLQHTDHFYNRALTKKRQNKNRHSKSNIKHLLQLHLYYINHQWTLRRDKCESWAKQCPLSTLPPFHFGLSNNFIRKNQTWGLFRDSSVEQPLNLKKTHHLGWQFIVTAELPVAMIPVPTHCKPTDRSLGRKKFGRVCLHKTYARTLVVWWWRC